MSLLVPGPSCPCQGVGRRGQDPQAGRDAQHTARSVTTCRRATRPPRPLRRPRAPLPHGATWLAREHDCLEPILPRGPVPSIRGDRHRPDPFGVPTEKAGGKRDMSLLAERGGSLLTLPLCTGQTPGARRASPRGGQPDRRCEAPREAGDAAEVRLLPARPKPLRGGRRVTQASAGPCPRPRPVSPRPPRTQVATMADSHTALTCAPRPRLTPATAPESVEVSGVILGLTGEKGQGRPPPRSQPRPRPPPPPPHLPGPPWVPRLLSQVPRPRPPSPRPPPARAPGKRFAHGPLAPAPGRGAGAIAVQMGRRGPRPVRRSSGWSSRSPPCTASYVKTTRAVMRGIFSFFLLSPHLTR